MTPQARPAFELLRFAASPVGDALALVDVEGRFGLSGRFARRPALVVEPEDGAPLELAPVHVDADGEHWRAAYAIPAAALAGARFALAVRGTLVELPAPDLEEAPAPDAGQPLRLAREANGLRRQLERAEAQAAQAEDHAEAAEDRAATAEEQASTAQARIALLERAVRELEQRILLAEGEAEEAEHCADVARERARRAEHELRSAQQGLRDATERAHETHRRAAAAEERAATAEQRARVAEEGLEVLRAELAEERARSLAVAPEPPAQPPGTQALNEEPFEDDDAGEEDEVRQRTPPRGVVRTTVGARAAPRVTAPPVQHHGTPGPGRWLAVLALLVLVAVVAALVLGLRA